MSTTMPYISKMVRSDSYDAQCNQKSLEPLPRTSSHIEEEKQQYPRFFEQLQHVNPESSMLDSVHKTNISPYSNGNPSDTSSARGSFSEYEITCPIGPIKNRTRGEECYLLSELVQDLGTSSYVSNNLHLQLQNTNHPERHREHELPTQSDPLSDRPPLCKKHRPLNKLQPSPKPACQHKRSVLPHQHLAHRALPSDPTLESFTHKSRSYVRSPSPKCVIREELEEDLLRKPWKRTILYDRQKHQPEWEGRGRSPWKTPVTDVIDYIKRDSRKLAQLDQEVRAERDRLITATISKQNEIASLRIQCQQIANTNIIF